MKSELVARCWATALTTTLAIVTGVTAGGTAWTAVAARGVVAGPDPGPGPGPGRGAGTGATIDGGIIDRGRGREAASATSRGRGADRVRGRRASAGAADHAPDHAAAHEPGRVPRGASGTSHRRRPHPDGTGKAVVTKGTAGLPPGAHQGCASPFSGGSAIGVTSAGSRTSNPTRHRLPKAAGTEAGTPTEVAIPSPRRCIPSKRAASPTSGPSASSSACLGSAATA